MAAPSLQQQKTETIKVNTRTVHTRAAAVFASWYLVKNW